MEVCLLARGVILSNDATPIHLITRWPSLLPSSFTHTPIGSPYGLPSFEEKYGLTTFHDFDLMG